MLPAAALLLLALAGCGGGGNADANRSDEASPFGPTAAIRDATPAPFADLKRQRQGVAVGTGDAGPSLSNADAFFDYAERLLPGFFPGHSSTLKEGSWYYRSYFSNGVMIGVNNNTVYVLGGPFGPTAQRVGLISDFMPSTNTAPTARAGTAQKVVAGTQVTLDGSASSDAEGDLLSFSWTLTSRPIGSQARLSSSSSVTPSFLADVAGQYVATLVVSDGKASSTAVTVTITASNANSAPVANAGPAQQVTVGSTVTLNGSASSDADLDPLTYRWSLGTRPAGSLATLANATSSKASFVPDVPGTYVAKLFVNDGKVDSDPASVTITATSANVAPVANAGPAQTVSTGSLVTLDGSASSDANGDLLSYSWTLTTRPGGSSATLASASTARPNFIADVAGTYVAQLIVRDGKASSAPATVTITATASGTSGLSALYGRVTLTYKFTGGTTTFNETVTFSAADLSGTTLSDYMDGGYPISCVTTNALGYTYLCVILFSSGDTDNFLFNVKNGIISGIYEFCLNTLSSTDCANDLVLTPDGQLSGTVVKGALLAQAAAASAAGSEAARLEARRATKLSQPIPQNPPANSLADLLARQRGLLTDAALDRARQR